MGAEELKRRILSGLLTPEEALTRPPAKGPQESRFKGVAWHVKNKNWIAQIKVDRKVIYLGSFDDDVAAARAFDTEAKKYGRSRNFP